MDLTLTVQPPASPAIDVDVSLDSSRLVREVVDALVKATGVPTSLSPDMSMYLPLRDAWLNNEMTVGQAHFRVGEVVVLGRQSSTSVVSGDIVEKTKASKNKRSSVGTSAFELCVVSGNDNGVRHALNAHSLVVVDRAGRVRISDARTMMRTPSSEEDNRAAQFEFEGITNLDAAACHVECQGSIFVSPVTGKTHVEVRELRERTEIDEHAMLVCGDVQFFVRRTVVDEPLPVSERGIVSVNRPPRDVQPPTERTINIEAPPRDAPKTRINLLMIIFPVILGLGLFFFLKIGGHRNPMFLLMTVFTPVMFLAQNLETKRTGRGDFKEGKKKFLAEVEHAVHQLRNGRREELAIRRQVFPDAAMCLARVFDGRHDIWDRRRADIDFLAYRVGVGDQVALVSAQIASGGSDDLRDMGERKLHRSDPIHLAPLAIPLPQYGALGLVGDRSETFGVLRWMILQTITLQSHRDVSLCAALPEDMSKSTEFLKWLPHVRQGGAELEDPTVAFGADQSVVLFQKIRALIEARMENNKGYSSNTRDYPSVVAIIDETVVRDRTAIDMILKAGPSVGVYIIFLTSQFRDLPGECRAVVEVSSPTQSSAEVSVTYPGSGQAPIICSRESLNATLMDDVAQMIAAMRDVTASVATGGGGSLPKTSRLLDVLDLSVPSADQIVQRWFNPPESLEAVIGSTTDGVLKIDLRLDGPHALVAGTTGSGKSELLQTLVVSIASRYSPQKVNFLFVDYKGGSAFAECASIPHSVGMVTDLDQYLAQRVLVSLNAELKRREALLKEYGVKDLAQCEKRYPETCPPSLLIVIDEFAALAREVPEFVEGVVDIAQRGRSLGLHLILATQRPAGVVNDNIRANTNLRIALRIADAGDSQDVIGTDEAARIPRSIPGRGFIRRGPSDLQAFQTAYGGDFTVDVNSSHSATNSELTRNALVANPFSVLELAQVSSDDEIDIFMEDETDPSSAMSDIRYVCELISSTAEMMHLPAPRRPWRAPLATSISLHSVGSPDLIDANDPGRRAVLGRIDLPLMQDQQSYAHDFETDGNLFVYGTSGAGKTTTLRTIAGSLAVSASPDELEIHAIDCASGGLECLRELPHCASVMTTRDAESMSHFLSRMSREVEDRKEMFRREGVASLGEYRRRMKNNAKASSDNLARIVILIDSFAGFVAAFEKIEYGAWIDAVQRLTAEGRPLGIHLVITADRRGAIPFNMAGLVEQKLILHMADSDELTSLGVPHKIAKEIKLAPGRGLLRGEIEIQVPTVSKNPDGMSQVQQLNVLAQRLKVIHKDKIVSRVPVLPDHLSFETLHRSTTPLCPIFAVGIHENTLVPVGYDLHRGHLMVSGSRSSGKTTLLSNLIRALQAEAVPSDIYVFTPRPNNLSMIPGLSHVAVGVTACQAQLSEMSASFAVGVSRNVVIVVDDAEDLSDMGFVMEMDSLMKMSPQNIHVIAAGDPSAFAQAYSGWLSEVKKQRSGVLLKPDPQTDGDLCGVKLQVLPGQPFPPGRGYLCIDRQTLLIQVAQ